MTLKFLTNIQRATFSVCISVLIIISISTLLFINCQTATTSTARSEDTSIESVPEEDVSSAESEETEIENMTDEERQYEALKEYNLGYPFYTRFSLCQSFPEFFFVCSIGSQHTNTCYNCPSFQFSSPVLSLK